MKKKSKWSKIMIEEWKTKKEWKRKKEKCKNENRQKKENIE